jgi:uncharacterized protein (TIGR02118 family)
VQKFVALYALPREADEFIGAYFKTHLPLVGATPGLLRTEVARVTRSVRGDAGFSLFAEMYFADEQSLRAALKSPEWRAAGENLSEIGGVEMATMVVAEVLDST